MTIWVRESWAREADAYNPIAEQEYRAIGVSMKAIRMRGLENYVRGRRREICSCRCGFDTVSEPA